MGLNCGNFNCQQIWKVFSCLDKSQVSVICLEDLKNIYFTKSVVYFLSYFLSHFLDLNLLVIQWDPFWKKSVFAKEIDVQRRKIMWRRTLKKKKNAKIRQCKKNTQRRMCKEECTKKTCEEECAKKNVQRGMLEEEYRK